MTNGPGGDESRSPSSSGSRTHTQRQRLSQSPVTFRPHGPREASRKPKEGPDGAGAGPPGHCGRHPVTRACPAPGGSALLRGRARGEDRVVSCLRTTRELSSSFCPGWACVHVLAGPRTRHRSDKRRHCWAASVPGWGVCDGGRTVGSGAQTRPPGHSVCPHFFWSGLSSVVNVKKVVVEKWRGRGMGHSGRPRRRPPSLHQPLRR